MDGRNRGWPNDQGDHQRAGRIAPAGPQRGQANAQRHQQPQEGEVPRMPGHAGDVHRKGVVVQHEAGKQKPAARGRQRQHQAIAPPPPTAAAAVAPQPCSARSVRPAPAPRHPPAPPSASAHGNPLPPPRYPSRPPPRYSPPAAWRTILCGVAFAPRSPIKSHPPPGAWLGGGTLRTPGLPTGSHGMTESPPPNARDPSKPHPHSVHRNDISVTRRRDGRPTVPRGAASRGATRPECRRGATK